MADNSDIDFFIEAASHYPQWHWYAIADSAQSHDLPGMLVGDDAEARCLLGAIPGTPLAAQSPHLVSLPAPDARSVAWRWIDMHAKCGSSVTVLASLARFDELFTHLHQLTQVRMPDGDTMFFAFWDPAILGTLIGQPDDVTLHVQGPVLHGDQQCSMFECMAGWWYWDRDGVRHKCAVRNAPNSKAILPLQLEQTQVDKLVEASLPDHVLYFLDLNQPLLLAEVHPSQRYFSVSSAIVEARDIGLDGMRDLVNYVCAALIYKERLRQDENIREILKSVKDGSLSFSQALESFP